MELYEQYICSRNNIIKFKNKLNNRIKKLPSRDRQTLAEREVYNISKIQLSIANSMQADLEYSLRALEGYLPFNERYFTELEHSKQLQALTSKSSYDGVDADGFVRYPEHYEDDKHECVNLDLNKIIIDVTTERQRAFITTYYVLNVPTVVIADAVGITQPGVYKTISLGRDNIYNYFSNKGIEIDEIVLTHPLDPILLSKGIEREVEDILEHYIKDLSVKARTRGFEDVFVEQDEDTKMVEYYVQCQAKHHTKLSHTRSGLLQLPSRCLKCKPKPKQHNIESVKNLFESEGYVLLSDKYINVHKPLDYRCACGSYNKVTLRNFLRGVRCNCCTDQYKRKEGAYQPVTARRYRNKWLQIPASVYIVRLYNESEEFYKVGITTNAISARMATLPYNYEIICTYRTNLYNACFLENNLMRYHNKFKYKPNISFGGEGECFSKIMIKQLKGR